MFNRQLVIRLVLIVVVAALAALVTWPSGPDINIGSWHKRLFVHQGLDLKGGVELTYQTDLSKIPANQIGSALSSLQALVNDRVNSLGVTEPVIQTGQIGKITTLLVELPGVANVDQAIKQIGQFPNLKFIDESGNTVVTGADVQSATVTYGTPSAGSSGSSALGEPEVSLTFKSAGKAKFAAATTAAANASPQKHIAIYLDNNLISYPVVNQAITNGQAVISGNFTVQSAKDLAQKLNEGALPVPIKIIAEQTVGPTLGADSLKASLVAGFIGLLLIALFMIIYYRFSGLLATVALLIYTLINISLYKLIPVTVSLAGIAGFILSIGMAVDANILIFERTKEEIRAGKSLTQAIDNGFKRAWSSIRDSNFSTLITAFILYVGTSGSTRGFALTLAIGVLVSMFTAITITQVLLKATALSPFRKVIHA